MTTEDSRVQVDISQLYRREESASEAGGATEATWAANTVEDFDFNFSNGSAISITMDEKAGDLYLFDPTKTVAWFSSAEKPSMVDPEEMYPAEEVFIPLANVLCVRRRKRQIEQASIEEKEEWIRALRSLNSSGSIKH